MDTLKTVVKEVNSIPQDFWYAITVLMGGILVWVIQRYFAGLQETLKELSESIKDLTKIVTQHESRLENLESKRPRR